MGKYEKEIRAYALRNAIEHGNADASKILPKLFQHGLKKEEIKEVMPEIISVVKEVNKFSIEEKKQLFENLKSFVIEHEEKKRELAELPGIVKGKKVVFRVAPFPSGALHIGNARTFLLNSMYAEKYNGKLILVMDDTIGSAEKPIEAEAYDLIIDSFNWLGIKYDKKIIYKSDRLKIYYGYALKLIKKGKAYVCHCSQEVLKKNREEGKECGCRIFPALIQVKRWKDMFKMKEGTATLRIKTNMLDPNPAFRDRVLMKISDREHPRIGKKYRIWPTLEMSWAIDDHLLGITHIIRGNDLMIESDMERFIWKIFSWKAPEIIHSGLVQLEGVGGKLSKSKAQKEVKSGEFIGWHDPRTWSIHSLGYRGIRPEAIKEFIKEIGMNKQDITVPIDNLYSLNRQIIDADALRFSFVSDPIKLDIIGAPKVDEVEVPIHPNKEETRKIRVGDIYISGEDFNKFKGESVRLLHLYNVKLKEKSKFLDSKNKNIQKLNWISEYVLAKILMPDGKWMEGLAEKAVSELSQGTVIQFERFGFVRFDKMNNKDGKEAYEFWFAHK